MSLASQEIPTIQLVTLTDEGIQAGCDPMCAPACAPVCSPSCSPCFPAATPGRCNPELFCGPCGPKMPTQPQCQPQAPLCPPLNQCPPQIPGWPGR